MSNPWLWLSLDMSCDAPPYPIVQACRRVGLRSPEDVRWCRQQPQRRGRWPHFFRAWPKWLGGTDSADPICSCGQALPEPVLCTFTYADGREVDYTISQCGHCQTVYWDVPRENHVQD